MFGMKRIAPILIGATISGCSTTQIADSACRSFKPINWSKNDTSQTKREVVGHNKAYDAICPAKG